LREVKVHNPDLVSSFEEFEDGTCEARMFYRVAGLWRPPLPTDLELPAGFERNLLMRSEHEPSVTRCNATTRERPSWQLDQSDEPWRL